MSQELNKETKEEEVKESVEVKVCTSPDIATVPTPRIHDLVKKFKIKYPILFAILVVMSFCLGAGLSGGLTKLINYLYTEQRPNE